jgi:hypothetical protein
MFEPKRAETHCDSCRERTLLLLRCLTCELILCKDCLAIHVPHCGFGKQTLERKTA